MNDLSQQLDPDAFLHPQDIRHDGMESVLCNGALEEHGKKLVVVGDQYLRGKAVLGVSQATLHENLKVVVEPTIVVR